MSDIVTTTGSELTDVSARRAALIQLNEAAEHAQDAREARQIMLQAKALADLLESIRAPLEEARLAGKASVVAARKVGFVLDQASPATRSLGQGRGSQPSERMVLAHELGLHGKGRISDLRRLAQIPEPDFQRYIQMTDRIPSVTGCLATVHGRSRSIKGKTWRMKRRQRAGVRTPRNPSVDEGYSLIVRALGHISSAKPLPHSAAQRDISRAIDLLYEAEDLLKPHRGGYTR